MGAYAAGGLAAVMAVYFVGTSAGLSDLTIAVVEVALAVCLVVAVFAGKGQELGPVLRNRDLWLINTAFIAVLWNLWFFSFWSVSIVGDAARSSFGRSALIAAFNAGAGILGFPVGGWLSDVAVRRGIGRRPLVVAFTFAQMVHLIGEIRAVLSPAVSGVRGEEREAMPITAGEERFTHAPARQPAGTRT
jgi:MFS transporter, ACS family, D-galactonate transporter